MPNDLIRYDLLVREALCGVVKRVLGDVARHGLPGDHHFYITFRTQAAGVRLSSRMRELYPEEMTIILQHQFEDLKVSDHAFEVGLSFKGIPELLLVPFEALSGFFDPSVQFSMKLEPQGDGDEEAQSTVIPGPAASPLPKPHAVKAPPQKPQSVKPQPAKPHHLPAPALASVSKIGKDVSAPADAEPTGGGEEAKVVSIDAFRKKP